MGGGMLVLSNSIRGAGYVRVIWLFFHTMNSTALQSTFGQRRSPMRITPSSTKSEEVFISTSKVPSWPQLGQRRLVETPCEGAAPICSPLMIMILLLGFRV